MRFRDCFTYDWEGDLRCPKSIRFVVLLWLFDPQYQAVVRYRISRWLQKSKNRFVRRYGQLYHLKLARIPGLEINAIQDLGKGIRFSHPMGVVIGEGAIVKENVRIYNGVTLGAKGTVSTDENQTAASKYPTIERGVVIYPGARVLGGITIGKNSTIAANAVVLKSFPPNSVIAGVPARNIKA